MKTRLTLALAILACASSATALAEPRLGSQAFAKRCIKCQDEALRHGRSVGGFCPSDCAFVYGNEVCDSSGENCRPGPGSDTAPAPSTGSGSGSALDVPVMEEGGDGQAANCASSTVAGLKANGDGFLAVRSGPGSRYRKLTELHNGDKVIVFERRGEWAGIVYGTSKVECYSAKTRPVPYRKKGWVNARWLKDLAG